MTLQALAEIAARHQTRMADAMLAACAERACRTGEPLDPPERRRRPRRERGARPGEPEPDWDRVMRENRAPRWRT